MYTYIAGDAPSAVIELISSRTHDVYSGETENKRETAGSTEDESSSHPCSFSIH